MKENKVPQTGVSGESFSLSLHFEKEGRKEETTSAIYFSPPSTIYASLLGNLLFYILIPEIEE